MYFLFLIPFALFPGSIAIKLSMPVLIIDHENILELQRISSNPFSKISSEYFAEIIHDVIKLSERVLIFVEDSFCVEDLTLKDSSGTPFNYLHTGVTENRVKYIPNVVEPFNTLKQMFPPQDFNVFYLSTSMKFFNTYFKYNYVFFQDATNDTRVSALRRHDSIMKEAYFVVRKMAAGPVVAFYTGKANPVLSGLKLISPMLPPRIDINVEPQDVTIISEGALIRLSGVYTSFGSKRSHFYHSPVVSDQAWYPRRRKMSTRMQYSDFELEFNFEYHPDRWVLESVSLLEGGEEVGRSPVGYGARWNCSLYCAEPIVIVNNRDASAVVVSQYQVEPLLNLYDLPHLRSNSTGDAEDNSGKTGFGATANCGAYFNAPILTGLCVSVTCLAILFYGIVSMMNCQANNRYDDQSGKALVIVMHG